MKKPQITSGEWQVKETATGIPVVRLGKTHTDIMQMCYSSQSDELSQASKDMEGNAQAISAVPEMIDALLKAYEIVWELKHGAAKHLVDNVELEQIEQALIKAGCTE